MLPPYQIWCVSVGNLSFANGKNLTQLCKGKRDLLNTSTGLDFSQGSLAGHLSSAPLHREFNSMYFSGHDSCCAFKFSPVGRTSCLCPSESHCLPPALTESCAHLWTRHHKQEIRHIQWLRPVSIYPWSGEWNWSLPKCMSPVWEGSFLQRIPGHTYQLQGILCQENNLPLNKILLFSSLWGEYLMA